MRLLLDEMYSPALADALNAAGIDTASVRTWSMAGASDADVLAAAVTRGYVVVTENVADFTRLASDYASKGQTHCGVVIALSSRFSRRRSGIPTLVNALTALNTETANAPNDLMNRVVYLR